MKLPVNRKRREWLNTLPRKAIDAAHVLSGELAVSLLPVGVVGKAVCVSACGRIWNLGLTPYTHWWSSIEKRKLTAVLLMLINFAALQWDNDYTQISCFKASGSGKNNTLRATTGTCSKSFWDLTGESFHFPRAQATWGPWIFSTCLCMWRWFYCLRSYKPTLCAARFWKTGNAQPI